MSADNEGQISSEMLESQSNGNSHQATEGERPTEGMDQGTQEEEQVTAPAIDPSKYADNEQYKMYIAKKLDQETACRLVDLCENLQFTTEDFDERAVELLATFQYDQAMFILSELEGSQMYGVQSKSQYLMSMMRSFKDRLRTMGAEAMNMPLVPGPDPESIKAIINRTGYKLEVTVGQRKYHHPPNFEGDDSSVPPRDSGCIYIGQIPRDVYEDSLIPLFEKWPIFDLRLMMDPQNGKSRGYAFLIYCSKSDAAEAAKEFDGYEIQPGKALKVNVSVANTRLFIGNIPKSKSKEEILDELKKSAEGVLDVIIYSNPDSTDARKNRGFCFVDFVDHKSASDAKRRISLGKVRPWNNDLVVDWAEQQDEPDEETMATVKVLYVKNVKECVTEEKLKEMFEVHGEVERAKKVRDYAFIHFKERSGALEAMEKMKGTVLEDIELEISLAKPQGDMRQKKKLAMKRGGMFGAGMMPGGGMSSRGRGGRGVGGGGFVPEFYPAPARRGGGMPGYQKYNASAAYGAYHAPAMGAYDPYAGGYHPPSYGAYGAGPSMGGYDPYAGGYASEYYGAASYAPPPRGYPRAGHMGARGGRGYGGSSSGAGIRGGSGGRGIGRSSGSRGAKRPNSDNGGPASKRGAGRGGGVGQGAEQSGTDFSSDIQMTMF